jgi:hypothetical protein
VVLPWSTWPMVPTFTWGRSRLKTSLAMEGLREGVPPRCPRPPLRATRPGPAGGSSRPPNTGGGRRVQCISPCPPGRAGEVKGEECRFRNGSRTSCTAADGIAGGGSLSTSGGAWSAASW